MVSPTSIDFIGAEANRLAADIWGDGGHPVLLFHGGGQTRRAWDQTAQQVASHGMVAITVDMRGHGESQWVESGDYTFAANGADVAAVIRQTQKMFDCAPSAVGASLGGISSLVAEIHHGPLLASLVLVDITPRMNPEGVARVQGFMKSRMVEGFPTLAAAAEAISEYLPHRPKPTSFDGLKKNLRKDPDGRYRWHWDPRMMTGDKNIDVGADTLIDSVMHALPTLRPRVLLVRGMQSEIVDEDYAREFVSLAPSASYIDVQAARHMVAGDKNDVFSAEILRFLGAVSSEQADAARGASSACNSGAPS